MEIRREFSGYGQVAACSKKSLGPVSATEESSKGWVKLQMVKSVGIVRFV